MKSRLDKNSVGRIGVLLGGPSSERSISIKSGNAVYGELLSLGYDVIKIDVKDIPSFTKEIVVSGINVAFIALHGRFGEDGGVQQLLDEAGILYIGSGPQASRIALDKIASKEVFIEHNIPTPNYIVLANDQRESFLRGNNLPVFPLPFVVKPSKEGSSIGMSIVRAYDMIAMALDEAFRYDDKIIVERYIEGDDVTVGILDETPLPVVSIKPKEEFYNFEAKYTNGMSEYVVPAHLSERTTKRVQQLALSAHQALGCDSFSRVDMLISKQDNSISVLEVNTIPGLTLSSLLPKAAKAAGIDFGQMCVEMIRLALKKTVIEKNTYLRSK